ncbi:putative methyltransferase (TIGR04325 family) [Azospirillum agricola]|uniref:methyltransferase, TIGR04325 family n=1 Tax=Azospirillum agricola TaxID=1720247 RepID=UPI001AE21F93|nr:methyltransferase, TIGR04325 family [Azospirillum agricola]MBP2233270.1 putative methyltransferase (TIGR04325 family) [Azospirillum agricola]
MNRYSGLYKSISDAADHCDPSLREKMRADAVNSFSSRTNIAKPNSFKIGECETQMLMSVMASCPSEKDPLRVMDFGGGKGTHYDIFSAVYRDIRVEAWDVVELLELARAGKRNCEHGALRFLESIHEASSRYHVILSNGSLQYVDDPWEVIDKISKIDHSIWCINRLPILIPNNTSYTDDQYHIQNVGHPYNWQIPVRVCALNIWMDKILESHDVVTFWDCPFDGTHALPNGLTAASIGILLRKKS